MALFRFITPSARNYRLSRLFLYANIIFFFLLDRACAKAWGNYLRFELFGNWSIDDHMINQTRFVAKKLSSLLRANMFIEQGGKRNHTKELQISVLLPPSLLFLHLLYREISMQSRSKPIAISTSLMACIVYRAISLSLSLACACKLN